MHTFESAEKIDDASPELDSLTGDIDTAKTYESEEACSTFSTHLENEEVSSCD